MICYKCDMCLSIHENLGEMNNLSISYAGIGIVNFPNGGNFHICKDCSSKLLKDLHAFSEDTK